jgi:hypothetical protein
MEGDPLGRQRHIGGSQHVGFPGEKGAKRFRVQDPRFRFGLGIDALDPPARKQYDPWYRKALCRRVFQHLAQPIRLGARLLESIRKCGVTNPDDRQ